MKTIFLLVALVITFSGGAMKGAWGKEDPSWEEYVESSILPTWLSSLLYTPNSTISAHQVTCFQESLVELKNPGISQERQQDISDYHVYLKDLWASKTHITLEVPSTCLVSRDIFYLFENVTHLRLEYPFQKGLGHLFPSAPIVPLDNLPGSLETLEIILNPDSSGEVPVLGNLGFSEKKFSSKILEEVSVTMNVWNVFPINYFLSFKNVKNLNFQMKAPWYLPWRNSWIKRTSPISGAENFFWLPGSSLMKISTNFPIPRHLKSVLIEYLGEDQVFCPF